MAGSQLKKQELAEAQQRVIELERELQQTQQLLAIHAPNIVIGQEVPPLKQYSDNVPKQIKALGKSGLSEDEMIVALGAAREDWEEWKERFPGMTAALAHARDLALAELARIEREAMTRRLWGAHFQAIEKRRKALMDQGTKAGDADGLVKVVRGYACPVCSKPKVPIAPQSVADTAG